MSKKVFYIYNPATDNFERHFTSPRERMLQWFKYFVAACLFGTILFLIVFYFFETPTESNLKKENSELKATYGVLEKRMEQAMKILARIQERDDNFYRVTMQMEPLGSTQRLAGLDNETRFNELQKLTDSGLLTRLTQGMDLMERQLFTQMLSFDQLKESLGKQKDKLSHIPAIMPIHVNDYTMSSGYGYRRDPIYGSSKFHEGLDFAANTGTPVFATGDGIVELARRQAGYGNCIDLNHSYNYMSRYAHLSRLLVKEGEKVKRGQMIGLVGSTGKSTGPHLHYEVRFKGEPQNPVNYYFLDLTPEEYAEMIQQAENAGHVMD